MAAARQQSLKANQNTFGRVAGQAARECHTFFLCGPDESAASAAATTIVGNLADAGERVDLSGAELRRDPVRLADEARSSSLFGDARHILVRATGEEAHDALKLHLEAEGEACPVLVVAVNATDKSRSAKLVAGAKGTLVAMFYPPNLGDMANTVRDLADRAGLRLGGDLAQRIARASGLDRRLAEVEVEKLALYLDAAPDTPKTADAAAWDAIGASSEEDGFMPLVNAALGGHAKRLPGELARLHTLALSGWRWRSSGARRSWPSFPHGCARARMSALSSMRKSARGGSSSRTNAIWPNSCGSGVANDSTVWSRA